MKQYKILIYNKNNMLNKNKNKKVYKISNNQ